MTDLRAPISCITLPGAVTSEDRKGQIKEKPIRTLGRLSWLVLLAAGGLGASSAQAQPKVTFPGAPWDFGQVLQDQAVSHQFEVKNVGKDTLFISRVKPACGCTSAPLTRDIVGPGESVWLDVTFSTKKFSGNVTKSVAVFCNDPGNPEAKFDFTADVTTTRTRVAPFNEPADLGQLVPNTEGQTSISFVNLGQEPYKLHLADWPQSWLAPAWTEKVVDPGDTLALTLGTKGVPPLGKFTTSLTFDVEGKVKTRMSLPVIGVGLVE